MKDSHRLPNISRRILHIKRRILQSPLPNENPKNSSVTQIILIGCYCFGVQVKTRVKLEGEELERYLEAEKEKEKSRQTTEATERRYL